MPGFFTGVKRLAIGGFAGLALSVAPSVAKVSAAVAPDHYRAYVDGPWGQIHVRVDGGANRPTILLVHKMVWSSLEFEKVQPLFAKRGYRTIAVDLPGCGLSDAPPSQPTIDDYADALIPVLDHFHLRKVEYLGVGTGAVIGVAMALRHPDRIDHLMLEGIPLPKTAAAPAWLTQTQDPRAPTDDGHELSSHAAGLSGMSAEAKQVATLQFFIAGPHYVFGPRAVFAYPLADRIRQVRRPTLPCPIRAMCLEQPCPPSRRCGRTLPM
jgi:pimeloyl-ACP methyl ester carboxylesterase